MNKNLTAARLIFAVVSTGLEEVAIWAIWRWALPHFGIQSPLLPFIIVMVAWAAFCTWLFVFTTRTLKKQFKAGVPSIIGEKGSVVSFLNPEGQVKIRGELWGAIADEGEIEAGEEVEVVGQNGLKLTVRKIDGGDVKR
jgi:membrane-bound serine protease (ClpP class)